VFTDPAAVAAACTRYNLAVPTRGTAPAPTHGISKSPHMLAASIDAR